MFSMHKERERERKDSIKRNEKRVCSNNKEGKYSNGDFKSRSSNNIRAEKETYFRAFLDSRENNYFDRGIGSYIILRFRRRDSGRRNDLLQREEEGKY